MESNAPKRRRLRVSLRVLMLAVLAAGVWMADRVNEARRQREAVAAVKEYGGRYFYDWQIVKGRFNPAAEPHAPRWLRRLVGDEYFQRVIQVDLICLNKYDPAEDVLARLRTQTGMKILAMQRDQVSDEGLRHITCLKGLEELFLFDCSRLSDDGLAPLAGLENLKFIYISGPKLTDAGLAHLARIPNLERADLRNYAFTDAGLTHLARSTSLTHLFLAGPRITDRSLARLKNMKSLQFLDLMWSDVTDEGLEHLKGLPNLKEIWAENARITDEGVARLRAAIPNLTVSR